MSLLSNQFSWIERLLRFGSDLRRDVRGSTMVIFALALPAIIAAVGAAVDFGFMTVQKNHLQEAVDAAALAAAREANLANADKMQIRQVAGTVLKANLDKAGGGVRFMTRVIPKPLSVEVVAKQRSKLFFTAEILGKETATVRARAVARVFGGVPVCVIGLDEQASSTVSLDSNAKLTAKTCAVYSNSKSSSGLSSKSNAVLEAELICSSGGEVGGSWNYKPAALTDCPPVEDPLAKRPAPPIGGCKAKNLEVKDMTWTLQPGVYCGGLRIDGNARVKFQPGVYFIKDGPFNVDSNSIIEGEFVGFYLTGKGSTFRFASNAKVTLTAPKDGPMAGLLFFEDRAAPALRRHEILSNYARELVGTIYLPNGQFIVDADNEVADQSAYTAIVARRIELNSGPNLVLNTDYGLTEIPVPEGIGGIGRSVALVE